MQLHRIDWIILISFFIVSLLIGLITSRKAGKSFSEYFLAGGNMPWWLLGISMVATTFSSDTPNLVADIIRKNGVSGNWVWWAFLLTGMLTVFVYAKLWKRSGLLTDLEFYEMRYSGQAAAFLRGFRALFLGVIFNCFIMATVILAGIKISGVLLGVDPKSTVLLIALITVIYTTLGGLKGVIFTDFFQFIISMIGVIGAAVVVLNLPEVGGINNLFSHPEVSSKINFLPNFDHPNEFIPVFIIPLAVQWWANWYPGAEPGGGGYIVQRMLSSKSESDATGATLLFNIAHYALRPWPWIIVALASLIIFPDLDSLQAAFPNLSKDVINDDLAYPAMLTFLPKGLLGLVIASLTAALMSTISTHLNWGSSYITHDFYRRFINPNAKDDQLILVGRVSIGLLMIISSIIALNLTSALGAFNIILQIGAGTGLIYILRWFWWRINAFTEIAGMITSLSLAIYFELIWPHFSEVVISTEKKLLISVGITTLVWLIATLVTRPTSSSVLEQFYTKVRPDGIGWGPIQKSLKQQGTVVHKDGSFTSGILAMLVATFLVYSLLFSMGWFLYGNTTFAIFALVAAIISGGFLWKIWPSLKMN